MNLKAYVYVCLIIIVMLLVTLRCYTQHYRAPYDAYALEVIFPYIDYDLKPLHECKCMLYKELKYIKFFLHQTYHNVTIAIYVESHPGKNGFLGIRVQIPVRIMYINRSRVIGNLSIFNIKEVFIQAAGKYGWKTFIRVDSNEIKFIAERDLIEVYGTLDKNEGTLNITFIGLGTDVYSLLAEIEEFLEAIVNREIDIPEDKVQVKHDIIVKYEPRYNVSEEFLKNILINEIKLLQDINVIRTKLDIDIISKLVNSTATLGCSGIESRLVLYDAKFMPYNPLFPPVRKELELEYNEMVKMLNEKIDEIPYNTLENLSIKVRIVSSPEIYKYFILGIAIATMLLLIIIKARTKR